MKKRLISFLLAVSMMLSILPVGAFATYDTYAAVKDINDLTIDEATGKPTTASGEGWTYEDNTLTIKEGYDWADYNFNHKSHPVITCKVVNYGILHGAVYTNTVTNYGRIVYGIYKQKPIDMDTTNSKEYYTISSEDGTAFGLNDKLFNITSAYSVNAQAIVINAPAGKTVAAVNGSSYYSGDNVSYTVSGDVEITFADKSDSSTPVEKIDLNIDENGYPDGTNSGQKTVLNGNGWSYQKTTLDNGENQLTLVIDKGTTAALDGKVVRVPVKCAGTLKGGTYTEPVEFTSDADTANSSGIFMSEPAGVTAVPVYLDSNDYTINGETVSGQTFYAITDDVNELTADIKYTGNSDYDSWYIELNGDEGNSQKVYFPDSNIAEYPDLDVSLDSTKSENRLVIKASKLSSRFSSITLKATKIPAPSIEDFNVSIATLADGALAKLTAADGNVFTYSSYNYYKILVSPDYDVSSMELSYNDESMAVVSFNGQLGNYTLTLHVKETLAHTSGTLTYHFTIKTHTPTADDFNYKTLTGITTDNVDTLAESLKEKITAKDDIISMDDVTIIYVDANGHESETAPTEEGVYTFKLKVKAAADGSYTATEQPLTSNSWTFRINQAAYDVTVTGGKAYILLSNGSKQYYNPAMFAIPVGTKVYLELDEEYASDPDFVFKGWQVAEGSTPLEEHDLTRKEDSYFIMPHGNVKLALITSSTPVDPIDPIDPVDPVDPITPSEGSDGTGVALVLGGAAIGGAAYLIGTEIYLDNVFGSVPTNRQQLAVALWNKAGNPEPVSNVLFTDISAEAVNDQKAARWCVEQDLLKDYGETFQPGNYIFRLQAIKAWKDLQSKLTPAE